MSGQSSALTKLQPWSAGYMAMLVVFAVGCSGGNPTAPSAPPATNPAATVPPVVTAPPSGRGARGADDARAESSAKRSAL